MRYKKNTGLVSNGENNGYIVLNMNNGNFYGLYDVSKYLWDKLDQNFEVTKVVNELVNEYNVEKNIAHLKINSFLTEMEDEGLVIKI